MRIPLLARSDSLPVVGRAMLEACLRHDVGESAQDCSLGFVNHTAVTQFRPPVLPHKGGGEVQRVRA